MNNDTYTAYRYFKSGRKKPEIMKRSLTLEGAISFCEEYRSTPNSFVGFEKDVISNFGYSSEYHLRKVP